MAAIKMTLRTGRKGFTLIEMLVVMAIIAMLLGASIPFTSNFGRGLRIKTSSRAVLETLRVAKSNAIAKRKKYSVVFDVDNKEYWIEDFEDKPCEKKHRLPAAVEFASKDKNSDPISFQDDRVIFYPTGRLEEGGSIDIMDKQGTAKTIFIIGNTGRISID